MLHACCHNPTGVDPTRAQWDAIIESSRTRALLPFLDIAYQGFADGLDDDGAVVRRFAATPGPLFVSSSFSKSFSLYGERVGALSVVTADNGRGRARAVAGEARRAHQLLQPADARRQIVATVLRVAGAARAVGEPSSATMRDRIKPMRAALVERCTRALPGRDFRFMLEQRGMFSYSGLTETQVQRLREEFSIYAIDTGRICVAALNSNATSTTLPMRSGGR